MKSAPCIFLLLFICVAGDVNAALIDRGDGLIYDDVLNVTWFQDANPVPEGLYWNGGNAWAQGISITGPYGQMSNWTLPSVDVNGDGVVVDCSTATESACRDNQLGYMFYHNLGGELGDDLRGDQGPFLDIQNDYLTREWYPFDGDTLRRGYLFLFRNGTTVPGGGPDPDTSAVWALRVGDISDVPIPDAIWFLMSALGLMFGIPTRAPELNC